MSGDRVEVAADSYFAIVPEWVLYADISSNAVRLYGVLRRHADKADGTCHPTRGRLAVLCRFSKATVDRALDELVAVGAVRVTNRRSKAGDWTSNQYVVLSVPPREVYSPVTTPLSTGEQTGLLTGAEQTRVIRDQSHERPARQKANGGDLVAKSWWEAQDPRPAGRGAWHSLLAACRAVADRGWAPEEIRAALDRIAAVPSVAQLDRELRNPRVESWSARKAREDREQAEKAAAMRRALEEEDRQRREQAALEAENAVPMPDHVREALASMRRRSTS